MANGLSRRALATGAAGLAAAGLAPESGFAGRRCRARNQHTTHVGLGGRVELDATSFVVERVTHVARFHHDDAAWEHVHGHGHHHAALVPRPGATLLYAIHGLAVPEGGGDAPGDPETFHATFVATGGSYDPATGRLVLEGTGRIDWPDSPGRGHRAARMLPAYASSVLPPAA